MPSLLVVAVMIELSLLDSLTEVINDKNLNLVHQNILWPLFTQEYIL